jgi:hypothetical protein
MFGVQGVGCRVRVVRSEVRGVGFKLKGLGFRV